MRTRIIFAVLVVLSVLSVPSFGQLDRGTLTGIVTDSSGSVVPGARITIRNADTGSVYNGATTAVGQFNVPNLPIGRYDITFESTGFKALVRRGIELRATQVARVDAVLEVGAVSESVEVTVAVTRLQTDTAEVGSSMSNNNLTSLPMIIGGGQAKARTIEDLAYKIMPGAYGNVWNSYLNGTPAMSKESLIEGASATVTQPGTTAESSISMESVQEFKLQTSSMSAEFGRTLGGVFNYVMKSGSNVPHGTAYLAVRNEAFNANTFINNFRGLPRSGTAGKITPAVLGGPSTFRKCTTDTTGRSSISPTSATRNGQVALAPRTTTFRFRISTPGISAACSAPPLGKRMLSATTC